MARPGAAVADVAGEALLAAVEIDGGDAPRASSGRQRCAGRWVDSALNLPFSLPSTTTCAEPD